MKLPLLVLPVGQGHPLVPGDDAVVDGHDGLGVHPHPGNLSSKVNIKAQTWQGQILKAISHLTELSSSRSSLVQSGPVSRSGPMSSHVHH